MGCVCLSVDKKTTVSPDATETPREISTRSSADKIHNDSSIFVRNNNREGTLRVNPRLIRLEPLNFFEKSSPSFAHLPNLSNVSTHQLLRANTSIKQEKGRLGGLRMGERKRQLTIPSRLAHLPEFACNRDLLNRDN